MHWLYAIMRWLYAMIMYWLYASMCVCAQDAFSPVSPGTDLLMSLLLECVQREVLVDYKNSNVVKHIAVMTTGKSRHIIRQHSTQGIKCRYAPMGVFKTDPGII